MSKKVFTLLLLAVFVLAQFSLASAAPAPVLALGNATPSVEVFSNDRVAGGDPDVNLTYTWQGADLTTYPLSQVLIWGREKASPATLYTCLAASGVLATANGNGSFSDATTPAGVPISLTPLGAGTVIDGNDVEFVATIDDDVAGCAGTPDQPGVLATPEDTTSIDLVAPAGYIAAPPSADPTVPGTLADCNTFNLYGLVQDWDVATDYSGVDGYNEYSTITSKTAPAVAALGADWMSLSWNVSIPSSAQAAFWFADPSDVAGNDNGGPFVFYTSPAVTAGEKASCKNFTDTAGLDAEAIIRYMADIGLVGGYADGTFGPDNVLTRAELATFIEISNGFTPDTLPTAAPSADCEFSDVAAGDWFAGWVWQACDDEFIAGYEDGSYGPYDTLTRAHVVTALNNVFYTTVTLDGYLNPTFAGYVTVLESAWGADLRVGMGTVFGQFSDVDDPTAYYYAPVYNAFGAGIADATDEDETTFSPDAPVTRSEFVTMLYRALSQYIAIP